MRLYVIRHGESVNNQLKIYTGWAQVPLSEKGVRDAERAGEILRGITFDKVYSSDLKRAMQTAEAALPGIPYEPTHLLREVDVGDLVGKPLTTVTEEMRLTIAKEGYGFLNGESCLDFAERVREFMRLAAESGYETVAAFCHRGWLMNMLSEVLGFTPSRGSVTCNNCTVAAFDFKNGVWSLYRWINL